MVLLLPSSLGGPFSPRGSGFGSYPACVAGILVETGGDLRMTRYLGLGLVKG